MIEASRLQQAECLGILSQLQAHHANTSLGLVQQADLLRSSLATSRTHFQASQDSYARIQESLKPTVANIATLSNGLPQIALSVNRLVSAAFIFFVALSTDAMKGSKA